MAIHILGIRHHGVGSAKNIGKELQRLKPDMVLVEGPPEIAQVFKNIGDTELKPPVAIMVYNSDKPSQSTFYPFAEYSPEWVAIKYANDNNIPVRAMDMPASVMFNRNKSKEEPSKKGELVPKKGYKDPLTRLAESSSFESRESWWEYHFEQNKSDSSEHFESVMHVMESLREEDSLEPDNEDNLDREVFMRSIINEVKNEFYDNIVVVCGAWHAPALTDIDQYLKEDIKRLKKLPKRKVKISCTWIPWTNSRLSMYSGYGAGIQSPGWYEHLWAGHEESEITWLTKVASTFRDKDIDISTAHVIEAFKLARSLASIRNQYFVSLEEMNDAILSVMCMGDRVLLELVREKLIVGDRLGNVPADIPKVPLQEDFEQTIKTLRLKLTAAPKQHNLDLRKDIDRKRSILFHRLEILQIDWMNRTVSRTKGTFKESWVSQWSPELMIDLIDKAFLGNTVESAAQRILINRCAESNKIDEISQMVRSSIPAELFEQLDVLLEKINELSSISSDILDLMRGIPQLIEVRRYGDVRKSDLSVLDKIIQQLLVKVLISLPNACYGLDEDNSNEMFLQISKINHSIRIYQDDEVQAGWYETLRKVLDKQGVHAIIRGCVCRLLLDAQQFAPDESYQRISFALSVNNAPREVAAWLEGFLRGNGMILIYDNKLWNLLHNWVSSLDKAVFIELLPLLRRSFSKFEYGERRQIGDKAKNGAVNDDDESITLENEPFDKERAKSILPTLTQLIGTT